MELSKMIPEIFSKLEQKWLHHYQGKKTRILTIDGGGTTGSVSGASLIHLEDQIQSKTADPNIRIADFFDIIAGTGIGGLYATLLTADDGTGRPLFTAKEAVNFVTEKQSDLFRVKTANLFRRRGRRFSGKSMSTLLANVLITKTGESMSLKNTIKPILVPCFDLNSSAPFVFSKADASQSPSYDFDLWKVIRATLASPSLFEPFPLTSIDGKTSCLAVDGGIVMNNPTSAAVTHVLHNKRDFPSVNNLDDLLVLSLGNGSSRRNNNGRRLTSSAIVNIAVDGVSETVDQMIANSFGWNRPDYVRIQTYQNQIINGAVLSEKGVETLPFGGKKLLTETNGELIGSFVQRLTVTAPPSPCKEKTVTVNAVINGS